MNTIDKNTVVVTGASSGIGRACVSRLLRTGWRVFAAIRKAEDGENLQREMGKGLIPVIMDVKDRAAIFAAGEQVESTYTSGV